MDGRLERIEGILMFDDEYSPRHMWDRLSFFCDRVEAHDRRLHRLEVWQSAVLAVVSFLMVFVMPLVTVLAPAIRRLLGLE